MPARKSKPTHESTNRLFEDLGFSAEEAAALEFKLSLHNEIMKEVRKRKLTSRQVEKILDIPQPRASELLTGKISHMSADRLARYLYRLGRHVKIATRPRKHQSAEVA